jgi:hypothetical protein
MPEAERKKIKSELENIAMPIQEKGADQLNAAIKAAKEARLFDGTVASLQAQLNKMSRRAPNEVSPHLNAPADVVPRAD